MLMDRTVCSQYAKYMQYANTTAATAAAFCSLSQYVQLWLTATVNLANQQ